MEQYYPKSNLTITSSFRTPKAGNSKQGFNFERAGVPTTSTHHSQMNKENNFTGITSKKTFESQLKAEPEQFGYAKASALDRKSYNFESYGTKQGPVVSNSNAYTSNKLSQVSKVTSQPLLMSHDMNTYTNAAARSREQQTHSTVTQQIQFTKNPSKADGRYAEKSNNYPQEVRNSRILTEEYMNSNTRTAGNDKTSSDATNGNIYLKLISNLSVSSPKTKDATPDARQNSSNRKAPQRASYDFAHKELLQSNTLKNSNKNIKPTGYTNENLKPAADDYKAANRKSFLSNEEDYSLAKASSVDRTKQPESTKNRSLAPDNQYTPPYFSRGESAQPRGFGSGTTTTQSNVGALGSPKYTSDKTFKFQEKAPVHEKPKNQEVNLSIEQEAANYENKPGRNSKIMSQKLEEYSNTLKKLEERIAKSKNERREEKPKSSPPLINNFTSDSKSKGTSIATTTQATSPKGGSKIPAYEEYEKVNDFGLQKPQTRDLSEKDRYKASTPNVQYTKGYYDTASQQPRYPTQSISEKEYMEYLHNKNLREAEKARQDSYKQQQQQTMQTRVKSAESFVDAVSNETKQASRTRPESAKTKKGDQTPTNSKKEQPIVQKSLKDFVTQVNAGSTIPVASKPRLENFDDREDETRYTKARLAPQSTKNSTVSHRYHETLVPQTTKHKDEPKMFFSNNTKSQPKKTKDHDISQSSFTTYNEAPTSNNTAIAVSRQRVSPTYYMSSLERHIREPDSNDYFCKIYREHFMQSFQAMNFCRNLKDVDPKEISKRKVHIPRLEKHKDKKTIVFDLDETLIHCNENTSIPYDILLPIKFPSGDIIEAGINIRPYARECLEELSKHFEIFVFTASHACYANVVLDFLDPENKLIQHRLFRESCVQTEEGLYVKDLRVFANRNLKDLVLVDNAVYSFGYQIENGIPIAPYYYHKSDVELKMLVPYLKSLASARDVREVNRKTFKLHYYPNFESPEDLLEKLFE